MRRLFFFLILFFPVLTLANGAVGWHWYNAPLQKSKKNLPILPLSAFPNATEALAYEKKRFEEIKAQAVLDPTIEHVRDYLIAQQRLLSLSQNFQLAFQKTMLMHPDLNFLITHPTDHAYQEKLKIDQYLRDENVIKGLSKEFGLFFFYRGSNALDQIFSQTVQRFAERYGFDLLPISIDGKKGEVFKAVKYDQGQANKLGVKAYPAIFLIDPENETVIPIAYGYLSDADLEKKLVQVMKKRKKEIDR